MAQCRPRQARVHSRAAIQTNNPFNAQTKFKDSGTFSAGLVICRTSMATAASIRICSAVRPLESQQSPTRSVALGVGPGIWVEDYSTATLQSDVMASLSTPPGIITGTWKCLAGFPCADFQHVAIVTYDTGSQNGWVHVMAINSATFAVVETTRYQFANVNDAFQFDQVDGFFNGNGLTRCRVSKSP